MCVVNELNCAIPPPPTVRVYSWFLAHDERPFRGTVIYVHAKWAKLVAKVQETEAEMDLEMIHLRLCKLPTLHILGAYLDSNPTMDHAAKVHARLEDKIEQIKAWDKVYLLIGDLNRPVYKPT